MFKTKKILVTSAILAGSISDKPCEKRLADVFTYIEDDHSKILSHYKNKEEITNLVSIKNYSDNVVIKRFNEKYNSKEVVQNYLNNIREDTFVVGSPENKELLQELIWYSQKENRNIIATIIDLLENQKECLDPTPVGNHLLYTFQGLGNSSLFNVQKDFHQILLRSPGRELDFNSIEILSKKALDSISKHAAERDATISKIAEKTDSYFYFSNKINDVLLTLCENPGLVLGGAGGVLVLGAYFYFPKNFGPVSSYLKFNLFKLFSPSSLNAPGTSIPESSRETSTKISGSWDIQELNHLVLSDPEKKPLYLKKFDKGYLFFRAILRSIIDK